jgi:hypothetical protein
MKNPPIMERAGLEFSSTSSHVVIATHGGGNCRRRYPVSVVRPRYRLAFVPAPDFDLGRLTWP